MPHILVVNDEPDLVDICELVLEQAGHQVHTLVDGKLAVARSQALKPDLVIIDWVLATCDARDVLQGLRTNPATARIPVLLMSAMPGASQSAKLYGFEGFLAKPFTAGALVDAVDATLRLRISGATRSPSASPSSPSSRSSSPSSSRHSQR